MKEPPILLSLFKHHKTDKRSSGPRKDLDIPPTSHDWGLNSFQMKYAHFWNALHAFVTFILMQHTKRVLENILYRTDF